MQQPCQGRCWSAGLRASLVQAEIDAKMRCGKLANHMDAMWFGISPSKCPAPVQRTSPLLAATSTSAIATCASPPRQPSLVLLPSMDPPAITSCSQGPATAMVAAPFRAPPHRPRSPSAPAATDFCDPSLLSPALAPRACTEPPAPDCATANPSYGLSNAAGPTQSADLAPPVAKSGASAAVSWHEYLKTLWAPYGVFPCVPACSETAVWLLTNVGLGHGLRVRVCWDVDCQWSAPLDSR